MTDYTRQRAWYDPDERPNDAVTIVGCGGIGSFTAVALAKLGIPKLHLIDFDTVEEHNLPNQMFPAIFGTQDTLGIPKVDVVKASIGQYAPDCQVSVTDDRFDTKNLRLSPVVIAGLDSMSARAELWQLVRLKLACKLFLDGRLAGQKIVHYAAQPSKLDDIKGYESTLYSDEDALEDSCTARSIIDVGFMIASMNVRATRLALTGQWDLIKPQTYVDQESFKMMAGGWS